MKRLLLSLTALGAASVPAQSAKVDFAKQIWPIFEKRCTECHRAAYTGDDGREHKPKGRVELDSLDGIKQSKRGKLVVAGDSGKSILYEVITLPADDDDVMPPKKKGKPLSQKETDLIKRWIDAGAVRD